MPQGFQQKIAAKRVKGIAFGCLLQTNNDERLFPTDQKKVYTLSPADSHVWASHYYRFAVQAAEVAWYSTLKLALKAKAMNTKKNNYKIVDMLVIVAAWLMLFSILYVLYYKFKFFFH